MWSPDDEKDNAKTVREMIFKENDLINNRLTWLVAIQGLLFTALSFSWNKAYSWIPILSISIVGIVVSITSGVALILSTQAIDKLKDDFHKNHENYNGPDIIGIDDPRLSRACPWYILPKVFVGAWLLFVFIFIFVSLFFIRSLGGAGC
jgi:hypothetical protein